MGDPGTAAALSSAAEPEGSTCQSKLAAESHALIRYKRIVLSLHLRHPGVSVRIHVGFLSRNPKHSTA
jgi:hypothetical protein